MRSSPPALVAGALVAVALSGCFSVDLDDLAKDPPEKARYLFDAPAPEATARPAHDQTLLVEPVHAPSPYNGRPFVYRTGPHSYRLDYYNEFLISPAEQLADILREHLRPLFRSVIAPDSEATPDRWLTVDLLALRGDFRDTSAPAAVLELRATLFAPAGVARTIAFEKRYARRVPLTGPAPADLAEGYSRALREILSELATDLR